MLLTKSSMILIAATADRPLPPHLQQKVEYKKMPTLQHPPAAFAPVQSIPVKNKRSLLGLRGKRSGLESQSSSSVNLSTLSTSPLSSSRSSITSELRRGSSSSLASEVFSETLPEIEDVLDLIDAYPSYPPDYSFVPPGGCPRFACYPRVEEGREELPSYTPSVYKISMTQRKLEWLSPYEPAPIRQWKNMIVEINSTQLNLYLANNEKLEWFYPKPRVSMMTTESYYSDNFGSRATRERDLQFLKYCNDLNALNDKTLIRSYSLQHAKIGAAQDYKKKKFVLRIRAETEQFLLSFNSQEEMVEWNSALCCARDLSLELAMREMPRYRTVPRRRRRARNRRRAQSDSTLLTQSSLRGGLFGRRSSAANLSNSGGADLNISLKDRLKLKLKLSNGNNFTTEKQLESQQREFQEIQNNLNSISLLDEMRQIQERLEGIEVDEDDDDDDEVEGEEGDEYDINDIRDIHQSDDEEEDEANSDSAILQESHEEEGSVETGDIIIESTSSNSARDFYRLHIHSPSISSSSQMDDSPDIKWNPIHDKIPSYKRALRDASRCITALSADEQWTGRFLVKPTTVSQGNILFLRRVHSSGLAKDKKKSFSFKDLPDTALGKLKNHYVKEYNVGPHGLIPQHF